MSQYLPEGVIEEWKVLHGKAVGIIRQFADPMVVQHISKDTN